MATITRLHPGPRMAQAVLHNGVVYLSGQVAAPGASVAEQTRAALAQVDALLAEAGSSKAHLLTVQIWLADMADFAEMNGVWDAWVDPANPPARATGEAKLATPDYRFEVIVTAAIA
jgi:enamine deaminase RidA (YjgF/YER057c/UK114 family)